MIIVYPIIWLVSMFQFGIEGVYSTKRKVKNTGGSLQHISTLKLGVDKSYVYTDAAFDRSGQIISSDTIKGEWFTIGDTLITKNYDVKWLVKRNSIIKLSATKLRYQKK